MNLFQMCFTVGLSQQFYKKNKPKTKQQQGTRHQKSLVFIGISSCNPHCLGVTTHNHTLQNHYLAFHLSIAINLMLNIQHINILSNDKIMQGYVFRKSQLPVFLQSNSLPILSLMEANFIVFWLTVLLFSFSTQEQIYLFLIFTSLTSLFIYYFFFITFPSSHYISVWRFS